MGEHDDLYNMLCKEKFDVLFEGQKDQRELENTHHMELMNILKGKNGDPGLIDNVRDNTKLRKFINWIAITVVGAFILQTVALIFFLVKSLFGG